MEELGVESPVVLKIQILEVGSDEALLPFPLGFAGIHPDGYLC